MERLPKRECYVYSDPSVIWDLIGWDKETRKYRLRNDSGEYLDVFHNEFVPVSLASEDLVVANETGQIVPAIEALEQGLSIAITKAPDGPPLNDDKQQGPKAKGPRKSEAKPREEAEAARAKVRDLLASCKTREEIASAAEGVLGVSAPELIAKYAHLDNGRFRMVLGNRMVGTISKLR